MSEELKPCSVCGENAASINNREGSIDFKPMTVFYVECGECQHQVEGSWRRETAIMNWNGRPIEDALRAELAESEKANFELSARACIHLDGTGIYGDCGGHTCCHKTEDLAHKDAEIKALDELVEAQKSESIKSNYISFAASGFAEDLATLGRLGGQQYRQFNAAMSEVAEASRATKAARAHLAAVRGEGKV